ncbi:MAG TPA: hypothetical protein VL049_13810 [Candidatus Dormibacteraeota bacterium]|nr:hypothetical protein [Candidatus Dormibacteraeota bacterium]
MLTFTRVHLGVAEAFGWQRAQHRPLQRLPQRPAALPVAAHDAGIEVGEQLGDARVQLGEREELLVAQPGENPPLGDQHPGLHLGLVARMRRARRHDHRAVVRRPVLLEGALNRRLVPARAGDGGLELVGNDHRGDPADVLQGLGMRRDPLRHTLALQRFGIGEIRRAEHGHEQLDLMDLARVGIDPVRLLAGEVGEQLLAGAVYLTHHHALGALPAPVVVAELFVAVAVGVALAVLDVQQRSVTPGFFSSTSIAAGSGSGVRSARRGLRYSAASSSASPSAATCAHSRPAAAAARTTSLTVPTPTPSARAIWRWRRPSVHFSRRISRILRIGSLSVAILASSPSGRGRRPAPRPTAGHPLRLPAEAGLVACAQGVITIPTSVITIPKRVITMPKSLNTIPKRPPDHHPEIGDHDAETGDRDGPSPAHGKEKVSWRPAPVWRVRCPTPFGITARRSEQ